jgi:hypothetical protein
MASPALRLSIGTKKGHRAVPLLKTNLSLDYGQPVEVDDVPGLVAI